MASITLTGTLLDPTGEVAVGDQIRFTHRTTTGETIQFARSVLIIPPNGLYNITLEFGLIFVEYLDIKDVNYKSLGVVTVNQDSTATSLPELLNAIVPPTDEQLLEFQSILADTTTQADNAATSAAEALISENAAALSASSVQSREYATLAAWQNDTSSLVADVATLAERIAGFGGGAPGQVISGIGTVNGMDIVQHGTLSLSWVLRKNIPLSPVMYGYDLNAANMTSISIVDANWLIMKRFLNDVKTNNYNTIKFDNVLSLTEIHAEWVAGRNSPVGFYSDSTTDGTSTTGHVPSTSTTSPFEVTVNFSPNAYPAKLKTFVNEANSFTTGCETYNGGFDGKSYASGFGLQHWYNVWFRGLAGSNVDFSDVKMIVIGFGTSDSINQDNLPSIIDDYSIDLECTIVDAILRGVQPVVQTPVLTTQHVGSTVDGRNGNESITIIQAVQNTLAQKYKLEKLSYGEDWEIALDNFTGYLYVDFMNSADMVHPIDMGHRVHAGYLVTKFNENIPRFSRDQDVRKIFSGHPAFFPSDRTDVISPASDGGLVLELADNPLLGSESYFYNWLDSEGNGKSSGEALLELTVYVEKPCILYQTPIQNNRTEKNITIRSYTLDDDSAAVNNEFDSYQQPQTQYYTHRHPIALLTFGLNKIFVNASNDGPDQKVGGFFLVDAGDLDFGRGTGGSTQITKHINFSDTTEAYVRKFGNRRKTSIRDYYNVTDNTAGILSFTLTRDLSNSTTYNIYTHYNDLNTFQQGYNLIQFLGDDITLLRANTAGETQVNTQNIAGFTALLLPGVQVEIHYKPQFFSPAGVVVTIFIDGVSKYTHTASLGQLWSDGYGFDGAEINCKGINFYSRMPFRGAIDPDKMF